MQICVINLERSPERRARITAALGALGLTFSIERAVDAAAGEHLAFPNYDPAAALRSRGDLLTPGEIGCFASHYRLWQRCRESGRPIMVLEDDAEFDGGLGAAVPIVAAHLDRFRLIRLQGLALPAHRTLQTLDSFSIVRCRKGVYGAAAYVLSPEGARILLEHARIWRRPVDVYLNRFWEHGLPCIALLPYPVRQPSVQPGAFASALEAERGSKPRRSRRWRAQARLMGITNEFSRRLYLLMHP